MSPGLLYKVSCVHPGGMSYISDLGRGNCPGDVRRGNNPGEMSTPDGTYVSVARTEDSILVLLLLLVSLFLETVEHQYIHHYPINCLTWVVVEDTALSHLSWVYLFCWLKTDDQFIYYYYYCCTLVDKTRQDNTTRGHGRILVHLPLVECSRIFNYRAVRLIGLQLIQASSTVRNLCWTQLLKSKLYVFVIITTRSSTVCNLHPVLSDLLMPSKHHKITFSIRRTTYTIHSSIPDTSIN